MTRRFAEAFALAVLLALALAGCATAAGPHPPTAGSSVEVVGTGTVIDTGTEVRLCTAVLESYPPQCGGGIVLQEWSWDGLEGSESASGTTWGSYAVHGVYDGEVMAVTQPPILLALYDPAPFTPSDHPTQRELDERFGEGAIRVIDD